MQISSFRVSISCGCPDLAGASFLVGSMVSTRLLVHGAGHILTQAHTVLRGGTTLLEAFAVHGFHVLADFLLGNLAHCFFHHRSLGRADRDCTNISLPDQAVWRQGRIKTTGPTYWSPAPLNHPATLTDSPNGSLSRGIPSVRIWTGIADGDWVRNWVHTQQQLRVIGRPALRARFDLCLLGLYRQVLEFFQVKTKPAQVTETKCFCAVSKTVAHEINICRGTNRTAAFSRSSVEARSHASSYCCFNVCIRSIAPGIFMDK